MKLQFVIALALAAGLTAPVSAQRQPKLTPIEVQALQSREYETTKTILFASVISVLQDLGYTIESAETEAGFIRGNSPTSDRVNFWEAMAGVTSARNTKVTAFVEPMMGNRARVRLNFVNTKEMSGRYGQGNRRDTPVLDPKTYQVAWEKIDEAIFVRSATAEQAPAAAPAAPTVPTAGVSSAAASTSAVGPPRRPAKTESGFCYDVPRGYTGLGSVDKPALTSSTPACYQLLER